MDNKAAITVKQLAQPLSQRCHGHAPPPAHPVLQDSITVTVVQTAQQLKDAVVRGDAHIEIQAHLDLSTIEPVDFRMLGVLPDTVKSIQVCTLQAHHQHASSCIT